MAAAYWMGDAMRTITLSGADACFGSRMLARRNQNGTASASRTIAMSR
jgi:hypothetical protein